MTPTTQHPAPPPPPAPNSSKTVLIIALVVGGLLLFCMCSGILAAIAIPNFIRFQSKAKQTECKMNLKALYTAQQSYFADKNDFADDAADVGFSTSGKTRYSYFGGPDLIVAANAPDERPPEESDLPPLAGDLLPGVEGECPDCTFTAACAGNIDTDETLDVWSISTGPRQHDGQTIAPGELFHDVDDGAE